MIRAFGIHAASGVAITAIAVTLWPVHQSAEALPLSAAYLFGGFLLSSFLSALMQTSQQQVGSFVCSLVFSWILAALLTSVTASATGATQYHGALAFGGVVVGCITWLMIPFRMQSCPEYLL